MDAPPLSTTPPSLLPSPPPPSSLSSSSSSLTTTTTTLDSLLSPKECATLLDLLSRPKETLETIAGNVGKSFPNKQHRFRIGCALSIWLRDDVLPRTGRIAAFYLLVDLYRNESSGINPFLPIFLEALERDDEGGGAERSFLVHLICSPPSNREAAKRTTQDVAKEFTSTVTMSSSGVDATALLTDYTLKAPRIRDTVEALALRPGGVGKDVSAISSSSSVAPDSSSSSSSSSSSTANASTSLPMQSLEALAVSMGVAPEFHRLPPPLFEDGREEDLAWFIPDELPLPMPIDDIAVAATGDFEPGDAVIVSHAVAPAAAAASSAVQTGSTVSVAAIEEARTLFSAAMEGGLTPEQTRQFKALLEREPKVVHRCGLSPSTLPRLVEVNPSLTVECLIRLIDSPQMAEFLAALVGTEMSAESMEVVTRLTSTVVVPSEFVHMCVSNYIASCENIKDKPTQNRYVRMVCLFVQSLIRNGVIRVSDALFVEVRAFCIEFSKIKEAAGLFRLLKAS